MSSEAPIASSTSVATDAPVAAAASAESTAAASSSSSSSSSSSTTPVPLPSVDNLTKMMIEKSLTTLSTHRALSQRGLSILYRNLYSILFGPMFSSSWENTIAREEQRTGKIAHQRTNVESLRRCKIFFTSPKSKKSGSCLALALLNPTSQTESFEHRMTLIWFGDAKAPRLFKIDGMKRTGVPGLSSEQTSWPAAVTEVDPNALWTHLQAFVSDKNPKAEWDSQHQQAWDGIVARPGVSTPFASALKLPGFQTMVLVTNDEEGLAVDLKNGLVERLKAITIQLEQMA